MRLPVFVKDPLRVARHVLRQPRGEPFDAVMSQSASHSGTRAKRCDDKQQIVIREPYPVIHAPMVP